MNKWMAFKALHLIYLGLLIAFIYFDLSVIRPIKLKQYCTQIASAETLGSNAKMAFDYYQQQYQSCLTKKSSLLSLRF